MLQWTAERDMIDTCFICSRSSYDFEHHGHVRLCSNTTTTTYLLLLLLLLIYYYHYHHPVASVEGRAMLRSANYGELVEPRTRGKRYGPHSFRVAAPFVWNNLPRHLRNDDISREQFARHLKTFLFARAYSSEAPLRTSV